jgi:hypothetical protein
MIDNGDCGAIGGMKIGGENRSTRRKPTPAPVPGDNVYKDHIFNKETVHTCTSHENNTIYRTNFHNTIQVHEHPQYKYMDISTTQVHEVVSQSTAYV